MLSSTSTFASSGAVALRSQPRRSRQVAGRACAPAQAGTEWILDLPRATGDRQMEGSDSADKKTTGMSRVHPINVTQLLSESKTPQVVIGTRAAYEEARKEWKDWSAPLAVDLTPLAEGVPALAALSVDRFGELYIEDMPGPHRLHVDGQGVGKGHKMRLYPGYETELTGRGSIKLTVVRDEKAHA